MDDLVRLGFLRRLPNRGFEVVHPAPERPPVLTRQILSLTEVAQRNDLDSRSELIAAECRVCKARELTGPLARVRKDLALAAGDTVSVLARCRLMKPRRARQWGMVAIEQSFIPTARVPGFMEAARQQVDGGQDSLHLPRLGRVSARRCAASPGLPPAWPDSTIHALWHSACCTSPLPSLLTVRPNKRK